MKIGIVGSRERSGPMTVGLIANAFDSWKERSGIGSPDNPYEYGDIIIVSGGGDGVDKIAESFAQARGLPIFIYNPDWKLYGKYAGPMRNTFIAKESDVLIAAPLPDSKGTRDTMGKFRKYHPDGELIEV